MFRQLRLALLAGLLGLALPEIVHAGQGCCSTHGGVAGRAGARLKCSDGTVSPSCPCDVERQSAKETSVHGKEPVQIVKNVLLKDKSVQINSLHEKMSATLEPIHDVWNEQQLPTPVITSGNDGKHPGKNSPGTRCGPSDTEDQCRATSDSFHYKNRAIDLRSHGMTSPQKEAVMSELRRKLGKDFKIGLHSQGIENEHIHIEYHGK